MSTASQFWGARLIAYFRHWEYFSVGKNGAMDLVGELRIGRGSLGFDMFVYISFACFCCMFLEVARARPRPKTGGRDQLDPSPGQGPTGTQAHGPGTHGDPGSLARAPGYPGPWAHRQFWAWAWSLGPQETHKQTCKTHANKHAKSLAPLTNRELPRTILSSPTKSLAPPTNWKRNPDW